MSKKSELWQTVSLYPLTGPLDTRSRPADIPPGAYRWKLNFQVTPEGKLCRRNGFQKFTGGATSFTNQDFHRQGGTREPITFQFESTSNDGTRRLYVGTQSGVWLVNLTTGVWTPIITGQGAAGTRWRAAELQDVIAFTNNNDPVYACATDGTGGAVLASLAAKPVTKAAVIVQYNGFLMVMNVVQEGTRQSSRILWSDLNLPDSFNSTSEGALNSFQDLDYGDDILAAAPLLGALYIFTRRSIWQARVSGSTDSVFTFTRVYTEPKNQTGCIAFPNTLVSTGSDLYYMGRDGIYNWNPYIPFPVRADWLHRADGLIYRSDSAQRLDANYCLSPVTEYMPTNREIWISWPSVAQPEGMKGVNDWTLVGQLEHKTADVVDHGFTSFVNFRTTPSGAQGCNETQDLIGASGEDWCLKSIGTVFYREMATLTAYNDPSQDIAAEATYYVDGYNSVLRGMMPFGLADREKSVRKVLIDQDTLEQDTPCVVELRIGRSLNVVDPNSTGEVNAPQWSIIKDTMNSMAPYKVLGWQSKLRIPAMDTQKLRPNVPLDWDTFWTARFLYFQFTIMNQDSSAAIGGDSAWQRIDFDVMAMPKP